MTIQIRFNFTNFVSNLDYKQRILQNQNLFHNIFLVKAVQNRAQSIR